MQTVELFLVFRLLSQQPVRAIISSRRAFNSGKLPLDTSVALEPAQRLDGRSSAAFCTVGRWASGIDGDPLELHPTASRLQSNNHSTPSSPNFASGSRTGQSMTVHNVCRNAEYGFSAQRATTASSESARHAEGSTNQRPNRPTGMGRKQPAIHAQKYPSRIKASSPTHGIDQAGAQEVVLVRSRLFWLHITSNCKVSAPTIPETVVQDA